MERYIERCLRSLFMQDCAEGEVECILVDDCSPDGSVDIVRRMLDGYEGHICFSILRHESNRGISAARNSGFEAARGDYVMFIDSDDHLEAGALRCFLSHVRSGDADVVMANSFVVKNKKNAMELPPEPETVDNSNEEALRRMLRRELFHTAWNKAVRRSMLADNGISFIEGVVDEDMPWSYLILLYAAKVVILPDVTYVYEDNPGSIMNSAAEKVARRIRSRISICQQLKEYPPRLSRREYNMYFFYVLTLAVDLYERDRDNMRELGAPLLELRDGFLRDVLHGGYWAEYFFFLTSRRPFYYVSRLKLFRRYYDHLASLVLKISKA